MSRLCVVVSALSLALVGCGTEKASVSGKVSYQGQPLPSGTVKFHGADGRVEGASIATDGKYTIADAPIGNVRITVEPHGATPKLPSSGSQVPTVPPELAPRPQDRRDTKHVPIPQRYKDPEKSGLTYTVSAGSQTHDIKLQP